MQERRYSIAKRTGVTSFLHIVGLVQERRNSNANAPELRLSCAHPLTWCLPVYPARQWHMYLRLPSSHRAAFKHGMLTQSSNHLVQSRDGSSQPESTWWRHQMQTFSALLALCVGNSPVTGEFPAQRPVTRSFDVFFDLRLYKRLSKQSWGWWF